MKSEFGVGKMRKALVNEDGLILNVIEIEKKTDWLPPDGCSLLTEKQSIPANPGDTWDGSKIIPQVISEVPESRNLEAEIDELKARLDGIEAVRI